MVSTVLLAGPRVARIRVRRARIMVGPPMRPEL
jgi:hypothetical protein